MNINRIEEEEIKDTTELTSLDVFWNHKTYVGFV